MNIPVTRPIEMRVDEDEATVHDVLAFDVLALGATR